MDCATGILIDFDKSQDSGKQETFAKNVVALPKHVSDSCMLEASESFSVCNKQFQNLDGKIDHSSPVCGVLIDLDFNEVSPLCGNSIGEVQSCIEIKVHNCESSIFAAQSNCDVRSHENETFSSNLKNKDSSGGSSSSGSSKNGINFSWSPSVIYNDADLLENEKFDFNMSMSSISPYRGNDALPVEENICKKCSCKEKPPKLSTPQKNWSLLNAAFISEISEEASKVVTHLSTRKKPQQKSFESQFSVNFSNLGSQLNDSGIEEQDFNHNDKHMCTSPKYHDDHFNPAICTDEITDSSAPDAEHTKSKTMSLHGMISTAPTEVVSETLAEVISKTPTEVNTESVVMGNIRKSIDDCIIANLNEIRIDNTAEKLKAEDTDNTENKENVPLLTEESDNEVFADHSENSETSGYIVASEELIQEEQPLSEQNGRTVKSRQSNESNSSLIRRETFTVKDSPLTMSSRSAVRSKKIVPGEGCNESSKEEKKTLFTPKKAVCRFQKSSCIDNKYLPASKKTDTPNHQVSLLRKDTYTVGRVSSPKSVPEHKNQGPSVRPNLNTPNKVTRISSVAGKAKSLSLSCKAMVKSRCESPPNSASASSKQKTPEGAIASGFRTPTLPKRTSLLPSRLSYSQSRSSTNTSNQANMSAHQASPRLTRTSSLQLSKGAAASTNELSSKKPSVPENKPRANSAGDITDSRLVKKNLPMKAIAPVSNMVKPSTLTKPFRSNAVSDVNGAKGNTPSSLSNRVASGRINTVDKSEQAKRCNSLSTPKSVSTPSKPRFLSQSTTPSTPVSQRKEPSARRLSSIVSTPKRFTPKRYSEKF